jgi:hypothetical protein
VADKDDKLEQLIRDYTDVFGSVQGQRVWDNLCKLTQYKIVRVRRDNLGRIDPYEVCRQEGIRSVMLHIDTMLKKGSPDA